MVPQLGNPGLRTLNVRNHIPVDLMWDSSKLAFYDFNLTSNSRNSIFTTATFYPVWNGIILDEVLSSQANAFAYFAAVNMVMNRYNGTFPVTFVDYTGLQWDSPNAWPPHQYIIMSVPTGQLNFTETHLPGQPYHNNQAVNFTATGPGADVNSLNGTVVNGGNATAGEGWAAT